MPSGSRWRTSPRRSRRRSWPASRRSTSSTARCARSSTTTCRCRATPGARSPRALRRRDPLRRDGLRAREARPRRRRHRLLRGGSQGDGPLLDVGAARRARPRRQPGPPAAGRGRAPAPRGPARLPPQPDERDAALPEVRREGPRRAPDPGDTLRQALDRRLGRRGRELDRPRPGGARVLRGEGPARPRGRGRGRPHPGPRGRGARRRRRRLSRQRRLPRGLEPGLDRLEPRVPRGRPAGRLRAVDADGALLPARLERHRGRGRPRLPAGDRGAADWPRR